MSDPEHFLSILVYFCSHRLESSGRATSDSAIFLQRKMEIFDCGLKKHFFVSEFFLISFCFVYLFFERSFF